MIVERPAATMRGICIPEIKIPADSAGILLRMYFFTYDLLHTHNRHDHVADFPFSLVVKS